MKRCGVAIFLAGVFLSGVPGRLNGARPNDTTEKWRILVDKVVTYDTRPHVSKEQVREIEHAGFNVIVPRWGGENLEVPLGGSRLNGVWLPATALPGNSQARFRPSQRAQREGEAITHNG